MRSLQSAGAVTVLVLVTVQETSIAPPKTPELGAVAADTVRSGTPIVIGTARTLLFSSVSR